MSFRRLNEKGTEQFRQYVVKLKGDGALPPPFQLLNNPETSEEVEFSFTPTNRIFSNRVELGDWLQKALTSCEAAVLYDEGFWNALALQYFDQICVLRADGKRKPGEVARYIFEPQRKSYRHLIWSSWWAIDSYGEDGRYLLLPISDRDYPLEFGGGEVMGQVAANQMTTSSPTVIRLGAILYSDIATGRQNKGSSGKGADSPRRLVKVLRQFQLTYDFEAMSVEALAGLLPSQFRKRLESL